MLSNGCYTHDTVKGCFFLVGTNFTYCYDGETFTVSLYVTNRLKVKDQLYMVLYGEHGYLFELRFEVYTPLHPHNTQIHAQGVS